MQFGVSAIGMVSSVGWDAITTCASVRAGVTRPQPLVSRSVIDPASSELEPVIGHPIYPITDGFAAPARWLHMSTMALADLLPKLPDRSNHSFWDDLAIIIVTPEIDGLRFMFDPTCQSEEVHRIFVTPVLHAAGLAPESARYGFLPGGRVMPFQVLADVDRLLPYFEARRLLLLVVDSWLDGMSLTWLSEQGRFHAADQADGLAPGEAAVALLIEPLALVARRGAAPMAAISGTGVGEELEEPASSGETADDPPLFEVTATGVALATAMRQSLEQAMPNTLGPYMGELYADLNGEVWRSRDFGYAMHRVSAWRPVDSTPHVPASSVGDVGAAAGAFGLAVAARALERGYATEKIAVVTARDDDGMAGACVLTNTTE